MLRDEYARRGYAEVGTPLLYRASLFAKSGHLDHYKVRSRRNHSHGCMCPCADVACAQDDMFFVKDDEAGDAMAFGAPMGALIASMGADAMAPLAGLKPMNCPGHCELYAMSSHSYRQLPLRFADFSPLHRNELCAFWRQRAQAQKANGAPARALSRDADWPDAAAAFSPGRRPYFLHACANRERDCGVP